MSRALASRRPKAATKIAMPAAWNSRTKLNARSTTERTSVIPALPSVLCGMISRMICAVVGGHREVQRTGHHMAIIAHCAPGNRVSTGRQLGQRDRDVLGGGGGERFKFLLGLVVLLDR